MPPIQSINCTQNGLLITQSDGTVFTFDDTQIPLTVTTAQELEDYINNSLLPSFTDNDLQVQVHVFSLSPLVLTAITANNGVSIAPDWWT